jgi:multimeric flavodoxin WrbA
MTKVLILYCSAYGHMERMAQAVAEGVRDAGVEADIKRVPELVPEEMAKQSGFKRVQLDVSFGSCSHNPMRARSPGWVLGATRGSVG